VVGIVREAVIEKGIKKAGSTAASTRSQVS
jgi:hypothetical protein